MNWIRFHVKKYQLLFLPSEHDYLSSRDGAKPLLDFIVFIGYHFTLSV
jgi:hypothetical protein